MGRKKKVDRVEAATGKSRADLRKETGLIGTSGPFLEALERLENAALGERPILLLGERGVGKELFAEHAHRVLKHRRSHGDKSVGATKGIPFVPVSCSELRGDLARAELFGYVKGAFTGAVEDRDGLIKKAQGGVLFLDELGEADDALQADLLRFLSTGRVRSVGAHNSLSVSIRLVAATNADLRRRAQQGGFRPDLLDRLAGTTVDVPPLRARGYDVVQLAWAAKSGGPNRKLAVEESPAKNWDNTLKALLVSNDWPGNVRELMSVVFTTMEQTGNLTAESIRSEYERKTGVPVVHYVQEWIDRPPSQSDTNAKRSADGGVTSDSDLQADAETERETETPDGFVQGATVRLLMNEGDDAGSSPRRLMGEQDEIRTRAYGRLILQELLCRKESSLNELHKALGLSRKALRPALVRLHDEGIVSWAPGGESTRLETSDKPISGTARVARERAEAEQKATTELDASDTARVASAAVDAENLQTTEAETDIQPLARAPDQAGRAVPVIDRLRTRLSLYFDHYDVVDRSPVPYFSGEFRLLDDLEFVLKWGHHLGRQSFSRRLTPSHSRPGTRSAVPAGGGPTRGGYSQH